MANELARRRRELGYTQKEVAGMVGVSEATVSRWESGAIANMRRDRIALLAGALRVAPESLMSSQTEGLLPANVMVLGKMGQVPLVGEIACGAPILAEENITDYIDLPGHIHADFALICKGESMAGAGIHNGDVVYIREQPQVENGQIAAVLVGREEATLKRFYQNGDTVTLLAENPGYPPMVYTGEAINELRILGLAVGFTHALV